MVKNVVDVIYGGLFYWLYGFVFSFGIVEGINVFCGMGKEIEIVCKFFLYNLFEIMCC